MADISFFTDHDSLKPQLESGGQEFGVINGDKFRIASLHCSKSETKSNARAITKGEVRYYKDPDDDNHLTCVLKPTEFSLFGGVPVAYFIYWGIKLESLLDPDSGELLSKPTDNNQILYQFYEKIESPDKGMLGLDVILKDDDPIDKFFTFNSSHEAESGEILGEFRNEEPFAFAVVLKTSFNKLKAFHLRSIANANLTHPSVEIKLSGDAKQQNIQRNSITNLMDPAAFFGNSILNANPKIKAKQQPNLFNLISNSSQILELYLNKRCYFDIRNENGLPFYYYSENESQYKVKLGDETTEALLNSKRNGWPIFYIDSSINASLVQGYSNEESFPISLKVNDSRALTVYYEHVYTDLSFNNKERRVFTRYQFSEHVSPTDENDNWSKNPFLFVAKVLEYPNSQNPKGLVSSYHRILSTPTIPEDENDFQEIPDKPYIKSSTTRKEIPSYNLFDNIFEVKRIDKYYIPKSSEEHSGNVLTGASKIIDVNFDIKNDLVKSFDTHFVHASISEDARSQDGNTLSPSKRLVTFFLHSEYSSMLSSVGAKSIYIPLSPSSASKSLFSANIKGLGRTKVIKSRITRDGAEEIDTLAFIDNFEIIKPSEAKKNTPEIVHAIALTEEEYNAFVSEVEQEDFFSIAHPIFFQVDSVNAFRDVVDGKVYWEVRLRIAGISKEGNPAFHTPRLNPASIVKDLVFLSVDGGNVFATPAASAIENTTTLYDKSISFNILNEIGSQEYSLIRKNLNVIKSFANVLSFDFISELNQYIIDGLERPIPTIKKIGSGGHDIEYASPLIKKTRFSIDIEMIGMSGDLAGSTGAVGFEDNEPYLNKLYEIQNNQITKTENDYKRKFKNNRFEPANLLSNSQSAKSEYQEIGSKSNAIPLINVNDFQTGIYSVSNLAKGTTYFFEPELQLKLRYDFENNKFITLENDETNPLLKINVSTMENAGLGGISGKVKITINKDKIPDITDNDEEDFLFRYKKSGSSNLENLPNTGFLRRDKILSKILIHELAHAYYIIKFPAARDAWFAMEREINLINDGVNFDFLFPTANGKIHPGHLYANPDGAFAILMESEFGKIIDNWINDLSAPIIRDCQFNDGFYMDDPPNNGALDDGDKKTLGL